MNNENSTLLEQVGFWSLLGPFIMLVTLTILLLNPLQLNLLTPLVALVSLPLCWKWRMRGLWLAQALLGSVLVYQCFNSPEERLFSDLLLGAAAALTFTITSLCSLEVEELMGHAQQEMSNHLQSYQDVKDRMRFLERQKEEEMAKEAIVIESLKLRLNEKDSLVRACEEAAEVMRVKTSAIAGQNESLLRELFQKRHECEKLFLQVQFAQDAVKATETKLEIAITARQEAEERMLAEKVAYQEAEEERQEAEERMLSERAVYQEAEEEPVLVGAATASSKEGRASSKKESASSKSVGKSKGKASKTNNWANTILSRWSESHDPSQ